MSERTRAAVIIACSMLAFVCFIMSMVIGADQADHLGRVKPFDILAWLVAGSGFVTAAVFVGAD